MKPRIHLILEQAIHEGIRRGYYRAHKHQENPTEEAILTEIETCTMGSVYEYFSFDDDVYS